MVLYSNGAAITKGTKPSAKGLARILSPPVCVRVTLCVCVCDPEPHQCVYKEHSLTLASTSPRSEPSPVWPVRNRLQFLWLRKRMISPPLGPLWYLYLNKSSVDYENRIQSTLCLGPNLLIFNFSSGASPAHNVSGWVLPLFSQQIFLTKEVDKCDGKMIVAHFRHCR